MIRQALAGIRRRWHPLHALRKVALFRMMVPWFDRPIWVKLHRVHPQVRLRLVRNASYMLNPRTIEPEIAALFMVLNRLFAFKTFYDVGANIGYYTWLLRTENRHLHITMFEPDPVNCALIRETLQRESSGAVRLWQAAVSDEEGTAAFLVDPISGATGTLERSTDSFLTRHYRTMPQSITVAKVTIDGVRRADGDAQRPVDLLKIDVEGHEEQVLKGADRTLAMDRPVVIFECFARQVDVISRLGQKGYVVLDAERLTRSLDDATNFLGLPHEYAHRVPEIQAAWKEEYRTWIR